MRLCFIKCELFETTADVSDNSYISLILKFYVWKSWNITSYHKCFMNHFWGLDLDEHQWRERELWADQKTSGTALVYDERQAVSTLSPVSALCNFEACAFFFRSTCQHHRVGLIAIELYRWFTVQADVSPDQKYTSVKLWSEERLLLEGQGSADGGLKKI